MNKDKLEKEAGESWWNDNNCSGALSTKKIYICGYLASAEPREKRIAELEAQIEKMKCFKNCQTWNEWQCPCARNELKDYVEPLNCPCVKWELRR